MDRLVRALCAIAVVTVMVLVAGPANGSVLINITQAGANVDVTAMGSLDLTGATFDHHQAYSTGIIPGGSNWYIALGTTPGMDWYQLTGVTLPFGTDTNFYSSNLTSGDAFSIWGFSGGTPLVLRPARTFFVTTKTSMGRRLLQSDRNAMLFIDVLRTYVAARKSRVYDFVVMPDHVHLLVTVRRDMTIERAMQLVKGGFSYRLKKETGYSDEVWKRGFSEVRAEDRESFERHREYIRQNPVKAGLVVSAEDYPYSFFYLARKKQQGLKPES